MTQYSLTGNRPLNTSKNQYSIAQHPAEQKHTGKCYICLSSTQRLDLGDKQNCSRVQSICVAFGLLCSANMTLRQSACMASRSSRLADSRPCHSMSCEAPPTESSCRTWSPRTRRRRRNVQTQRKSTVLETSCTWTTSSIFA